MENPAGISGEKGARGEPGYPDKDYLDHILERISVWKMIVEFSGIPVPKYVPEIIDQADIFPHQTTHKSWRY